ncbi:uncharacterized protein LOC114530809 [Dendronephthya gigantea]|uniref:uncharacterized protein LOC114530809 n=1 Tax=Dendronephthya gigantea TaxID=151771 RepID=UPI00106D590C|nr:uncharacterized protein LOC114530809 [Dendronephthya gigantea]
MLGNNCAVVGCGTSRRTKGVGIFKLPAPKNEEYKSWRSQWLNELTKTRVIDKHFRAQIENDRVFTCERYFREQDIQKYVCKHVSKLKELRDWNVATLDDRITMQKMHSPYLLPEYEIVVDDSLGFTLSVLFHWLLPENHEIYKKYYRSVKQVSVKQLTGEIMDYTLCTGVTNEMQKCDDVKHHVIPKSYDPLWDEGNEVEFVKKIQKASKKGQVMPAKLKAPISKTAPERIKLALQRTAAEIC